ncbi:hypothetical protein [Terriglobus sp. RCC_193]|uniref:hypothetical protein n=1 Tax=Terriglobus sp. RCC_193 TaxID=3239218 RepID=UPI003526B52C
MLSRLFVVALFSSSAVVAASAQHQPGTFAYIHTTQQTLADGTHIMRATHTVMIRDAYGRTRNENEVQMPGRSITRSVSIVDPIAGVTYFYQEDEGKNVPHTYIRFEMHRSAQNPGLRTLPATPPSSGVVAGPSSLGTGVVTGMAGGMVSGGAVPVSQTGVVAEMRPEVKNEDLGFDTVQGISCKSHRTTETYPVNFFGNDRPIVITRENCMSVGSGGMLVRNVNDDPRTGTQTMLLESATFADPAANVFQPPPDYTERKQNQSQ